MKKLEWYAAKTVYRRHIQGGDPSRAVFEERIVLVHAFDFEHAIAKAEREAEHYSAKGAPTYLGFVDVYLIGQRPEDGVEMFRADRESDLSDDAYLDQLQRDAMVAEPVSG